MKTNNNNSNIQEELINLLKNSDSRTELKSYLETLYSALMLKDREQFLKNNPDSIGNGFYDRDLNTSLGSLNLSVPRADSNPFRPSILPEKWKRTDSSYDELVKALAFNNYSPAKMRSLIYDLDMPYSFTEANKVKEDILLLAKEFKSRELPQNLFAVLIDAYHTELRDDSDGKIKKAVIFTILGITLDAKKTHLGFYLFFGSENKSRWIEIFNNIISRGMKKSLLIVSDDFPGLCEAINTLFPNSDHQLCFVHLKRNIIKNMSKIDSAEFLKQLEFIKSSSSSAEAAVNLFVELCDKYKSKYPHFIDRLILNKERYFPFINYPYPVRKLIYTTNAVENFNSLLEKIRINNGGYFQSRDYVDAAVFVLANRLLNKKWNNPIPVLKGYEYEINQLFNLRFSSGQTQFH